MRQFAVIGLGRFGSSVAETLTEKGHQVLAIDKNEEIVQDMSEIVTHAVCLDATDDKALKSVEIQNIDVAVVSIGAIEASILITLTLKEMGIKEILAKAVTADHGKVLTRVGADRIVFPERDMGIRIANSLTSPNIIEQINISHEYSILEVLSPKEFIGKSLREIDVRAKYGINVIALRRKGEKVNISPTADHIVKTGDKLLVIGANEDIEKLKQKR